MRQRPVVITVLVVVAGAIGLAGSLRSQGQQASPIKRTVVLKEDTSIAGREAVMAFVEIPVGAAEGKHTHPADVYAFVQEGTISLEREGSPTVTLKGGDVFRIPQGVVHQATNIGNVPAKLNAVFIAEKGKPLTTPVKP